MKRIYPIFILFLFLISTVSSGNSYSIEADLSPLVSPMKTVIDQDEQLPSSSHPFLHTEPARSNKISRIELPWIKQQSTILEWWIQIEYQDEVFNKQIPIDITDFQEKFLKHPEYGEKILFNIDTDPEDDIEVTAGFYWSIIKDEQGNDVKSLEKRIQVRQLETGGYIQDQNAELQLWSELHINYGLIKKKTHIHLLSDMIKEHLQIFYNFLVKLDSFFNRFSILTTLYSSWLDNTDEYITANDADYFVIGAGFNSPENEDIPRYAEKRFAIARENLFSPSLFKQQMDPGSSTGKGPFELLYGFKAFRQGSHSPSFDIAFSIGFNPAVFLKTRFIPANGQIYYHFDDKSQQNKETDISFTSNVFAGDAEDVELVLTFDEIDETLGQTGRWMKFDIDILGDNELLGGKFQYDSSHIFDVGILVNSPLFEEKVEIEHIPRTIDISWNLDLVFTLQPTIYASTNGFIDIDMSDNIGALRIYYPNSTFFNGDNIFIDLPEGLPRSSRVEADVSLSLDMDNMQNPNNYVSGRLYHQCSENIGVIDAYLPRLDIPVAPFDTPIIHVTDIPSLAEAKAKIKWNNLQGYAQIRRNSSGPPDPVEINVSYGNLSLFNHLEIRQGYIDTQFKLDKDGYFNFDTSHDVIGNVLSVSNTDTSESIGLSVEELSADNFGADWNFETTPDSLNIPELSFSGKIDRLKNLQLNIDYQGKRTDLFLDWMMGQTGSFMINIDQDSPISLNFDQFAPNDDTIDLGGDITIAEDIAFDMSWKLQQGEKEGGNVDPGSFTINEYNDETILQNFDFFITYKDQYGVNISVENIKFYLDFEWWKGDRLLPYVWLDYEISADEFDVDLLWTNQNQETKWYKNVEEWR